MMVLCTNFVFLAPGSSSTPPGDLELVLLLLSIFLICDLKELTLAFWIIENKNKRKMDTKSNKRPREEPVANKKRLVSKTIIYDESKPNQWLDDPPLEIWDHVIIPMLGFKDLALARPVCTFFEAYWQDKFSNNVLPLRVGLDVATINDVMGVIEILSSRREYTNINPFVVLFGKGEHQITSSWTNPSNDNVRPITLGFTCSNITFVGTGIDATTILGGFGIHDLENITFKNMTVTNTSDRGRGIVMSNAKVKLIGVALKGCEFAALRITSLTNSETTCVATRCEFANSRIGASVKGSLTSAKFNNCVFHDNENYGIFGWGSTIHLHGEATAIHSNGGYGMFASSSGKIVIHLPSHHNTSYNNGDEDRRAFGDATITNVDD